MKIIRPKSHRSGMTEALKVIKNGGLVISPSDTVYGALVDATNEKAVEKLIEFKARPAGKAISIFVSDLVMLQKYVQADNKQLQILKKLLPGPFTLVLKSKHKVSRLLESEDGTLGVRIPDYPFITELVKKFGKPVTATSANVSGKSPVYSIDALMNQLSGKKKELMDLIIDAGQLSRNKPSTVIDLTTPQVRTIREGNVKFSSEQTFTTNSPEETKKTAKQILNNYSSSKRSASRSSRQARTIKPLIFILEGELGVGKTIFVKGIGEYLGVKDIISPTYVIYYEYPISKSQFPIKSQIPNRKLVHIDLYNLEKEEEFEHLGLEKYLKDGNILCIEWGEKASKIYKLLKEKGKVIHVTIKYLDKNRRELKIEN